MRQIKPFLAALMSVVVSVLAGAKAAHAETGFVWAPTSGDELVFDVYRDGKPFGMHRVQFEQSGDQLKVETDIELKVKFGPITAFHYVHDANEVWSGGELVSVDAKTKSGGDWKDVSVRETAGGLKTAGPAFEGTHPSGLIPSTHWNIAQMRQDAMLSTETGAILPMKVEDLGMEMVQVGDERIRARHYRVTSDLVASFWYDDEGRWVKCAFEARGSDVEYVLRSLPRAA